MLRLSTAPKSDPREAAPGHIEIWEAMLRDIPLARLMIALYSLSLLILLLYGFIGHFRSSISLLDADEAEYIGLSTDLLNGIWNISPRRTLGFPLLVAGFRYLNDNLIFVQASLSAVYACSAPALFAVVYRLTRNRVPSVFAAALLACWPTAIFYGTSLYSETAALPVFLAALAMFPPGSRVESSSSPALPTALAAGMLLGAVAHIRPMYLLFLPIMVIFMALEERAVSRIIGRALAGAAGFFLVVAPWSMYMSSRYGRIIVLTANGGETLAGGLTPKLLEPAANYKFSSGGRVTWVGPGKWLPVHQNGYLTEAESKRPYAEVDTLLQKSAIDWASTNPVDAIKLELYKIGYMWGLYPLGMNGAVQTIFGNVPLVALLLTSLALLAFRRDLRFKYARLWTSILFVSGIALISWGSWRFRQPADAGLLAFLACSIWALRPRLSEVDPSV